MNIDGLSYEQLLDLNRRVVKRLEFMDHVRTHSEMMQFDVGDRVQFTHSGRGTIAGVLAKHNRKTVTVVTEEGQSWNVSPSLLTRLPTSTPKRVDGVIDIGETGIAEL